MAYGDLLRALTEEAEREARLVRDEGAREAERLLAEARAASAAERERALAHARAEEQAALARARARAARDAEAAVLREARSRLDRLRASALEALRGRAAELLLRLVDELAALAGPGPAVFRVDPGAERAVREHLAAAHPQLLARARVLPAPAPRGGVELEQEGVVLDDTLPSRLDRAWPALEPELAALLAGGPDGRV